jgi:hypothetical protein
LKGGENWYVVGSAMLQGPFSPQQGMLAAGGTILKFPAKSGNYRISQALSTQ